MADLFNKFIVVGESNEGGFFLSLARRRGNDPLIVKSDGFEKNTPKSIFLAKKARFYVERCSLFLSVFLFVFLIWTNQQALANKGFWMGLIAIFLAYLCLFAPLIVLALLMNQIFFKKTNQWHACEHKAANMLLYCDEITLENLKKEGRCHPHCGSVQNGHRFTPVLLFFFCSFSYILNPDNARLAFLFYLIILSGLFATTRGAFDFILQYLFTTRKPTEEQLKEALRIAKIVREKMNSMKNI